ncbi:MAG: PEGA domain-containing protein [Ignavibacteria bacterium]|jgi:hypothetical protein
MKAFSFLGYFLLSLMLLFFIATCEREISVTPPDEPPPDGFLLIDSYPDSARIFLNGKDRLRSTLDSLGFLETGTYEITLKKDMFNDTVFTVDAVEGERKEIFVDYSQNPGMYGQLTLTSKPAGAEIFIDDSATNKKTPYTFSKIFPGQYNITYKYENHFDISFTVTIQSSELSEMNKVMIDSTVWSFYTTENSDIPTNNLTTVVIDQVGLLWIGSTDGLIRYDYISWKHLTNSNSELPDNNVNAIDVNSDNNKWIATNKHIGVADNNTVFKYYDSREGTGLKTSTYVDIFVKKGTSDAYYFASDIGVVKYVKCTDPDQDPPCIEWGNIFAISDVTSVISCRFGIMYGTADYGVGIMEELYTKALVNIPSNKISSLAESDEGVWIGHLNDVAVTGGLSLYDGNSFQPYRFSGSNITVNAIFVDSHNNKWIGTNIGIYKFTNFDDKILIDYDYSGLPIENVTGFAEDGSGNIWFTTEGSGLFLFKDGLNR